MLLLDGHSLNPGRKVPMEAMSLQLKERDSSASFTPRVMTGITTGVWLKDEDEPGKGIVWRVRSLSQSYNTETTALTLEHTIATLKDRVLFGEITPKEITGISSATTCTARQAVQYILRQQSDWVLGAFDYDSVSNPYKFEGDTLYDALETVTASLADAWWTYDFSTYPFRLNITRKSGTVICEMRAGRNIKTISKRVDRSGMFTRFYPIGKDSLKLGGAGYVEKNTAQYGVISKVETDETIETEAELTRWANERLAVNASPVVTIEIEGVELAEATGESLDRLVLGTMCRVPLPDFDETLTERITELRYGDKLYHPMDVKITLANNRTNVTKIIADAAKKTSLSGRAAGNNSKKAQAEVNARLNDSLSAIRITGPDKENKYTLQYQRWKDTTWRDAQSFSRAVTGWSVVASADTLRVTAKPQEQTKAIPLRMGPVSRRGTVYSGYVQYSGNEKASWTNTNLQVQVDAADVTRNVTLKDPEWTRGPSESITGNSNTVTISTSGRSPNISESVGLYLVAGDWNTSGRRYVYINQGDSTAKNRVARLQVDAHLNDPTWQHTPSESITGNSNAVTVSSATGQSETVALYMTMGSWASGSRYVYVCHTDSADAHRIARYQVSIPNPTNLSNITTYGQTPPSGGYSFGNISKSGITAGRYMSMTAQFGGKTFTFYFQVVA